MRAARTRQEELTQIAAEPSSGHAHEDDLPDGHVDLLLQNLRALQERSVVVSEGFSRQGYGQSAPN